MLIFERSYVLAALTLILLSALASATGYIAVESNPTFASVSITGLGVATGNNYTGTTPMDLSNVPAGPYVAIASKSGYQSQATFFDVSDGLNMTYVFFNLSPVVDNSKGMLWILSTPANASVLLIGTYNNSGTNYTGMTPMFISNITVGKWALKLNKSGFFDYIDIVNVTSNHSTVVNATLVPLPSILYGSYVVSTTPALCSVNVTGDNYTNSGLSPLSGQNVSLGMYVATAAKEGFYPSTQIFAVSSNQTTQVAMSLVPLPPTNDSNKSRLWVDSVPVGAEVRVIGTYGNSGTNYTGFTTMWKPSINPGKWIVRLNKSGYFDYMTIVNIYANQTTVVNKTLIQKPN